MPNYRKLYNGFDMGERTDRLTDFELRVWLVYRAAADDFGVCPMLPSALKGKSRRLSRVSDSTVRIAMDKLVTVGLCVVFEHQRLRYLCQPDWQDREEIRFPRTSTEHPAPPQSILGELTEKTRKLFGEHSAISRKKHGGTSEISPRNFGETAENSRSPAGAGGRQALALTETLTETQTQTEAEHAISAKRPRAPGLITSSLAWDAKHGHHVTGFCDWKCFFQDQFDEFARQLPGLPFEAAASQVRAWALDVRERWTHSGRVPADQPYDFWRFRWQETHGSSKPTTSGSAPDPLAGLRTGGTRG